MSGSIKIKNKQKNDKVRCRWLRQAKKCLVKNEKAKQIGEKIQITFRQPKNLKKMVTGLPTVEEGEVEVNPGCFKCEKYCHTCIFGAQIQAEGIISNRRCHVSPVL